MSMTMQIPQPLYEGNGVTVGVTFANPVAGQPQSAWPPVDPSEIFFTWIGGTGAEPVTWQYGVDMQIVRVSTGVYLVELDTTDAVGRWQVKWVGTVDCAAVGVAGFPVTPQPF